MQVTLDCEKQSTECAKGAFAQVESLAAVKMGWRYAFYGKENDVRADIS